MLSDGQWIIREAPASSKNRYSKFNDIWYLMSWLLSLNWSKPTDCSHLAGSFMQLTDLHMVRDCAEDMASNPLYILTGFKET